MEACMDIGEIVREIEVLPADEPQPVAAPEPEPIPAPVPEPNRG
jgi:hypothetical protein